MKVRARPGRTRMAQAAALAVSDNRIAKAVDAVVAHLKDPKNVREPALWELGEFTDEEGTAIFAPTSKAKDGDFDFNQLSGRWTR